MAEISHAVSTLEDTLEERIFIAKIVHESFFSHTHVLSYISPDKLILEPVNSPANVRRKRSVDFTICGLSPPQELCFVLEENVLIRSLNKEPFNPKMRQNRKGRLRMPEGISRDRHPRVVIELLLEEMQPQFEVLDDIVIVSTSLVMLDVSSS